MRRIYDTNIYFLERIKFCVFISKSYFNGVMDKGYVRIVQLSDAGTVALFSP